MAEDILAKRRETIRDLLKHYSYEYNDPETYSACLDGAFGKRRTNVLMKYLDTAHEKFKDYGLSSIDFAFAEKELHPHTNYDYLNDEDDISLAAALWMLEQLKMNGAIFEAQMNLPMPDEEDIVLQEIYHPLFPEELIAAMKKALPRECMTEEYVKRTERKESLFLRLTDLIPQSEVLGAVERFKAAVWQDIDIYMRLEAHFDKKCQSESESFHRNYSASVLRTDQNTDIRNPLKDFDRIESAMDEQNAMRSRYREYFLMDRKSLKKFIGSGKIADMIVNFRVPDPYEACFAMYYMLETGDDMIWLVNSCCDVLELAVDRLPWTQDFDFDEMNPGEEEEDDFDNMTLALKNFDCGNWIEDHRDCGPDYFAEKHMGLNMAQMVYNLSHCVLPNMHPFSWKKDKLVEFGMDPEMAAAVITAAEVLHLAAAREYDFDGIRDINLEKPSCEDQTEPENEPPALKEETCIDTEKSELEGKISELQNDLDRLKRENKSLKRTLSEQKRASDYSLSQAEKELAELRLEHRELADLREYIYNHENDVEEDPETESDIEFPYHTEKRTVIFGGHETWLKAIRPMIPDVRYVEANNYSFSQELIRGADQVWIQPNRMAHAQFYNIIGLCRKYSIPVRYFSFASAEKCARQFVDADQNKD